MRFRIIGFVPFVALLLAVAIAPNDCRATVFTWDGDGGDDNVFNGDNWVGGVAPATTADSLTFPGPLGGGASVTPTVTGGTGTWFATVIFDSGAPTYTLTGPGVNFEIDAVSLPAQPAAIANNSSNYQVINNIGSTMQLSGIVAATSGDVVINTGINVGSGASSGSRYVQVDGANDVYFNVDSSIHPAGDVNGGAWISSTTSNMYNATRGRFIMDNFAGTAYMGDIGTGYRGTFLVNTTSNGALRLTHDNALGQTTTTGNPGLQIWGGTTGSGTVELTNNITTGRAIMWVDGRSGAVADDPHLLNVSGDNTFHVAGDWNTGLSSTYGEINPGNINLQSDSGSLTITGGPVYNTNAGDWTLVLAGAADGDIQSQVTNYLANPGINLMKKGAGTWTLSNALNDYAGSTTVDAGKLIVNGSHTGVGTYTVNPAGTLGGAGTISAAVNQSGVIAPGASAGTLTIGGLAVASGSGFDFELDPSDNTVGGGINDLIDVAGLLDVASADASTMTLNVQDVGGGNFGGIGTWTLLTYDSINPGLFNPALINITGLASGVTGVVGVDVNNSAVVLTTVPEPTTFALGGIAALSIAVVGLRRRRCAIR